MPDAAHLGHVTAQAAFAVAHAFFESLDVEQTCWRIAHDAARALGPATQCLLFEYDHAANVLVAMAASGADVRDLVGERLTLGAERPSLEVLRSHRGAGAALWLLRGQELAALQRLLRGEPVIAEPLAVRSELIGLLLFASTKPARSFSTAEAALAHQLAQLAGSAVHNARLYRNAMRGQGRLEGMLFRMSRARERERKTFAATVHDDVLQSMVGALYALDALRDTVKEEGLADYDHVIRMLRLTVEDARRIIWDLRPAVLDGLGLAEALEAIADRMAIDGAAEVSTHLKPIDGIGEGVSTALYRVGREALLNADRHAQARHIDIRLALEDSSDGSALKLTVVDDGCGFDTQGERPSGHFGLVMMEEQAAAVGGLLRIESRVGEGTNVQFTLPAVRVSPDAQGEEL